MRAFCLENNLGYEEDTLIGSYRQTLRSLRGVVAGGMPRLPAGVPA